MSRRFAPWEPLESAVTEARNGETERQGRLAAEAKLQQHSRREIPPPIAMDRDFGFKVR
jgi:hypothetical protein